MAEATEAQDTKPTETIDLEEKVNPEEESPEASDGDDTTEGTESSPQDQEFEVVLESPGSQPDTAKPQRIGGINKRINKLNAKVDSAQQGEERANNDLLLANERNRLLQIQLDQHETPSGPVMPNLEDFAEGATDPDYVKKYQEYMAGAVQTEITRQVNEATQQTVHTSKKTVQSQELERKQVKHYQRANDIGAKDYAEVEDEAISILGNGTVNQIINNFEESHIILYYLGKNPHRAQFIADQIQTNPIKAIVEIEALRSKLKVKPKTKITPNPDTPLPGGSPSGANDTDKKATNLLANAEKTGTKADLNKYLDHMANRRKEAAKAGTG